AGEIGSAQVGLLADAQRPATVGLLARDEDMLVGEAKTLRFATFAKVMAYWRYRADQDGEENQARDKTERRRFHLSQSWEDMWIGDLVLDPVAGAIVDKQISTIEKELF